MNKRNTLKVIGIFALVTVLTSSFVGCGNNATDEDSSSSSKAETITKDNGDSVSSAKTPVTDNSNNSPYKIGDIVTYGSYEQDNNEDNGAEPIQWEVVDIQDGKALLLSRYVIDKVSYNEPEGVESRGETEDRSWEFSDVYQWLCSDFVKSAFTESDIAAIVQDDSISDDEFGLFLLSFDEAVQYFNMQEGAETESRGDEDEAKTKRIVYSQDALCMATPYANRRKDSEKFEQEDYDLLVEQCSVTYDESVIGNEYSSYWLRTSYGDESDEEDHPCAFRIDKKGVMKPTNTIKETKTREDGIRPAVWVYASSSAIIPSDGSEPTWLTDIS